MISTESIGARTERFAGIKRGSTIAVPLAGIVATEALLYSAYTDYAIAASVVTLFVCTLAPLRLPGETNVFTGLALVPAFRLVNLTMPMVFADPLLWLVSIYAPFLPVLLYLYRRQEVTAPDAGPEWATPAAVLLALPLAIGLAHVEFLVLEPAPLIPTWTPTQVALVAAVSIGLVGVVEELLFRGILQRRLQSRFGRWAGLVVTSTVFGLMHSGYRVPPELAFATVVGFLFGFIYDWTDSIALVAVVHGVLNVFLFAVIPIQGPLLSALS